MLRLTCPSCQARLKVADAVAGKRVTCPKCRHTFAAQAPAETAPVAHPEVSAAAPTAAPRGGGLWPAVFALLLLVGAGVGYLAWSGQWPLGRMPAAVAQVEPTPPAPESPAVVTKTDRVPDAPRAVPPTAAPAKPGSRGVEEDTGNVAEPAKSGPPRRFALLVGVRQYDSKELTDLNFTERDVEELADVLLQAGYPRENVVLLTQKQGASDPQKLPTAERIRASLDALLAQCTKDDLLLIAFAGHGIELKNSRKYYFCPLQAALADPATLVSLNEVYDKLKNCAAGYKLLLADACRNDPGARGPKIEEEAGLSSVTRPQFAPPPGGVMAFYSCSPSQFAYEPEELKHGVFFHYLIEGLRGAADLDGDGEVIREELEAYVKKRVRAYTADKLKREQWPHLLGESNDQRPLVTLSRSSPSPSPAPVVKISRQELADRSRVLLNEDFRGATEGKPPRGWNGRDLYAVVKGKEGRPWLQATAKQGVTPTITLPDTPLAGDFFIECEVHLSSPHDRPQFDLRLEALGESVALRLDGAGMVRLGDKPSRLAEGFKSEQVNRIRLVREGRVYRVSVNDTVALATPLPYLGGFDRVHLTVTTWKQFGDYIKLYAVRAGLLPSLDDDLDGEKRITRTGKVLLEEDFTKVPPGRVPTSWDGGRVVLVQKPEADRAGLEADAKDGEHPIALPSLALRGDCFFECETNLGSPHDGHKLTLRLEGKGGAVALAFDGSGTIALADKPPRKAAGYEPEALNRIRLVREGDVYRVSINDVPVFGTPLDFRGEFTQAQLLFTAAHQFGPPLKVHGIRAGTFDAPIGDAGAERPGVARPEPDKPAPAAPAKGVKDDFRATKAGGLPPGWKAAAPNIGVQTDGEKPGLELTDTGSSPGVVLLPPVDLKGDFLVECLVRMPDPASSLLVQLENKSSRVLSLVLQGDGKMALQGRAADAAKSLAKPNEANRLRLERVADVYVVLLNDTRIGQLPVAAAPGEVEFVKLALGVNDKANVSPRVYSVRVEPTDEAKKP